MKVDRDSDTREAIFLDDYLRLLSPLVLKDCTKPWINEARNVYGSCREKVVPAGQCMVAMPEKGKHEHHNTGKMSHFEELIAKIPNTWISCKFCG